MKMYRLILEGANCLTMRLAQIRTFADKLINELNVTAIGIQAFNVGNQYPDTKPGVTVNVTFLESHLAIHTWPEIEFAVMEISSCKAFDANSVITMFNGFFMPMRTDVIFNSEVETKA